jgi:TetR/AcrR family transcriptional regulator, cholesterol catabolism regulator
LSDMAQRRALARSNDDPDYRLRRAELIDAAARVFRRKGFQAAKLQDIAEELGKDRASLYYYTSGKDELFQDIVAEAVLQNVLRVEALRDAGGPADEKVAALVTSLMQSYGEHYPYLFVYVQEPMAHLEGDTPWNRKMAALGRRFDEAVRAIIQQGLDEGSLSAPIQDARLIANGIIGMCNWSHRWFQPSDTTSAARVGDVFAAMVLQGLAPAARKKTAASR